MIKVFLLVLCISSAWTDLLKIGSKESERIVGGAVARAGQFPFIAAIYINKADGSYFCSGTLISGEFVLTAGQCVEGATLFTVHLGKNSLTEDNPNGRELATETYFLHPDYNPLTLENDIGLIRFRSIIIFSEYVRPVGLVNVQLPDYSAVLTMGWGQTSDETAGPIDQLNYVFLTTVSNDACRITFGSQITDTMVCVVGNFNEGTCLGDTGGPLLQYSTSQEFYYSAIASFYSGRGCDSTDPSGFTRITPYRDWIHGITNV